MVVLLQLSPHASGNSKQVSLLHDFNQSNQSARIMITVYLSFKELMKINICLQTLEVDANDKSAQLKSFKIH